MTDNTSRGTQRPPSQDAAGTPVPVVGGDATAEELSAVVAIVAVLADTEGAGDPARSDSHLLQSQLPSRSAWSAPDRMVRKTHRHGAGGWRASASPP